MDQLSDFVDLSPGRLCFNSEEEREVWRKNAEAPLQALLQLLMREGVVVDPGDEDAGDEGILSLPTQVEALLLS